MWNSKEQLLDINIPRSMTLSEEVMISMFGLAYIHYNYQKSKLNYIKCNGTQKWTILLIPPGILT